MGFPANGGWYRCCQTRAIEDHSGGALTKLQCAILDDYQQAALAVADWSSISDRVDCFSINSHLAQDALADAIRGCAVVIAMRERTPFQNDLFTRLPNLRLLVTTGMRNASIDLEAARLHGVTVCGTASRSEPPAELTWGLILAMTRNLVEEVGNVRAGRWQTSIGRDLAGRTLGILGLGKIGTQVARVGAAFGMNIIAWSPNLTPERAAIGEALMVEKDELFAQGDIVSIHMALSERTAKIVGRSDLARMSSDAILVNTSRAGLVDNNALIEALRLGRIKGAGIDVFDIEPLPGSSAFRSLANVVATPHLGYVTYHNYQIYYREAVEDIAAFLDGKPLRVLT